MRRTWLFCTIIALCPILALAVWHTSRVQADKPAAPASNGPAAKSMPLTQVVLFNTGLGYFQREGSVEGDARVDLTIPTTDINDLLKTLLIDDGGKPGTVSFDGAEPMDSKLRSFGVDLAINPTLGQLLNQARGEKVEVTVEGTGGGAALPMTGSIVGMEAAFETQVKEHHHLNLLCSDGVRRVPLERIQRVRFLDPTLEDEFRRALSVLSSGRSDQRRVVSLQLRGEGQRKVKIGHVADTPIWKATYRLVLDGKQAKPRLQGWAIVENTTEEDWKDVRVVLVSGRPITFQMDLAQQLFMPRPKVEPEVYASLRPHTHAPATGPSLQGQGALGGGLGALGGGLGAQGNPGMLQNFQGGNQLGGQAVPTPGNLGGVGGGMVGSDGGGSSAMAMSGMNRYQFVPSTNSRMTYEELQSRRDEMLAKRKQSATEAKRIGSNLAELGDGIDDVFTNAERIGEGFRYSIEPRVSLIRQKSALLSMLNDEISVSRLSVYTPTVHPRFPLHAVRVKNSTEQHLQQGPVAVYDGADYVGDCRLPDMQPGQERLLTFAMDLGVEIRPEQKKWSEDITSAEINEGVVTIHARQHQKTTYQILNRSKKPRTVQIEHAIGDMKLAADSEKPAETTRQNYRFSWDIESGKTERKSVVEAAATSRQVPLTGAWSNPLNDLLVSANVAAAVKDGLKKVQTSNRALATLVAELATLEAQLKDAKTEQARITTTLGQLPAGSEAHKRYLSKFEEVDKLIDKLTAEVKGTKAVEVKERGTHDAMVRVLSAK